MKKALIIFLSMVLIFALAACGEKGEEEIASARFCFN
jgi:predicted small lipoprotein YifL